MAKCGCASLVCTCRLVGGANVEITGTGTKGDPYTVGVPATLLMQVVDTGTVDMHLTGSGAVTDPYVLSADASGAGGGGVTTMPPGMMMPFAGLSAPAGWLLAAGQPVSRTTFSALFAALGGTSSPYGLGDGTTTFNLPDMRGRVAAGLDAMVSSAGRLPGGVAGAGLGAATVSMTEAQVPPHGHDGSTISAAAFSHQHAGPSHSHSLTVDWRDTTQIGDTARRVTDVADITHEGGFRGTGSVAAGGTGLTAVPSAVITRNLSIAPGPAAVPIDNVQPTLALNYLVKT